MSEEAQSLYPNNLDIILAKIDSVRAPKSEGLVFVRVWVDELQNFERSEVLASTNTELATWVRQYVPLITWTAVIAIDSWYDLRLEFQPIPDTSLPMVEGLSPKYFDSWMPVIPALEASQIAHSLYQPSYISIDDSELRQLRLQIEGPSLLVDSPDYLTLPLLPVPERIYPYLSLETEDLTFLEAFPFDDTLLNVDILGPSLVLMDIEPIQLAYMPLDCEELSAIKEALTFTQMSIASLQTPEIPTFRISQYALRYIPLETEDIVLMKPRGYNKLSNLSSDPILPATFSIEIEPYQPAYIELETYGLNYIKGIIRPSSTLLASPDLPSAVPLERKAYQLKYIALDCSELAPIIRRYSQQSRLSAYPVLPATILFETKPYQASYIGLETDDLTSLRDVKFPSVNLRLSLDIPSVALLERTPYQLEYIGLDCSELSPISRVLTQSSRLASLPAILEVENLRISVPGWSLPYIALDSDELDFVAKLITSETSIAESVRNDIPDWRAPDFVINEIFDPIDTKGLNPLIERYFGLSAPRIHALTFRVELPEFRFRTYLDTEELSPINLNPPSSGLLSSELVQNLDWRPRMPVSQFDLERAISIPCMPEIAIFPENMQEILDLIPYPETARKLELEGEVRFRIWLDEEGHYLKHEVMESLPYLTRLCEYLLPDVEYLPVLLHGNPVPFKTEITFYFDMNRGDPSQCHHQDTRVTDDEFSN
ncbi:MAG: energy transducer TonB [Bacteroidia bacterium]